MSYLTKPFLGFIFALEPVWLPLLLVDVFAILLMVFAERFNPRTLIFWISVVVIVPFAGFLLYLLFGSTLYSRWRFTNHKHAGDARFLGGEESASSEGDRQRAECLEALGADVYTSGNDVRFYWNGTDMVSDMAADIASARSSVHIMARRMPGDRGEIHRLLAEKAAEGVDVRLMTSTLGFGRTRGARDLKRAGVRFCTFHNPVYSMLSVRPANRNYRAMAVIDGRVAYQGRGASQRVEGPAAERLERRFRADWMYGAHEDMGLPEGNAGSARTGCTAPTRTWAFPRACPRGSPADAGCRWSPTGPTTASRIRCSPATTTWCPGPGRRCTWRSRTCCPTTTSTRR